MTMFEIVATALLTGIFFAAIYGARELREMRKRAGLMPPPKKKKPADWSL